ncbi:MAG: septum formation inhibitor Maf [Candidatus Micrarchaeota archaeon]|nr:septum formation inhibitor Maf [Candidatus Micrarchaeota archaeon]
MDSPKIILASNSERRAGILRQLGIKFEIMPSGVDEASVQRSSPRAYVRKLATLKAAAVSKAVSEGIVIGVDTVAYIDGRILGKPRDNADAAAMLALLDGKVHSIFSGVCVVNRHSGKKIAQVAATKVKFRKLGKETIEWYVGTGEPMGKAGGYAIQGAGARLVEWVHGDYYNVVGLPVFKLLSILDEMGIKY